MHVLNGIPDITSLKNNSGLRYLDFRKKLKPAYYKVWIDMLFCFLMMFLPVLLFSVFANHSIATYVLVPLCALWSAFWIQAYNLFFHESAHFNIHDNKNINDMISNIVFTPFFGVLVKSYRLSHWEHHKHLGSAKDTEISYMTAVSLSNALQMVLGIYHVKMILKYFKNFKSVGSKINRNSRSSIFLFTLLIAVFFQFSISYLMLMYVSTAACLSWIIAYFFLYPMISNLRQTLEHRPTDLHQSFTTTDSRAVNRIFGTDFFSKYFGAAGFNRHLLHHYDPLISYTNFNELESFLKDTQVAEKVSSTRSTYPEVFKIILKRKTI